MRTKTLVLVLGLVVLAVAVPATYVLAHRGFSSSYYGVTGNTDNYDEEWWQEMRTYMEQRWGEDIDDDWWNAMRAHMEQRWGETQTDAWWNEMREFMEERWADQNSYGPYSGYGGYGRCGGMRW